MIVENFIGRIYESNNFGKFQIIDEAGYTGKDKNFVIKFLDTGYITEAGYNTIRHGAVRDKMLPIIAEAGFIGSDINTKSQEINKYYNTWRHMICRCYDILDDDYNLYGELGVKVDQNWYNFTTFYHDCPGLPNFEKKERYPDRYQLDKDYLQFHIPKEKRIYSKYTCIWISDTDNIMLKNLYLAHLQKCMERPKLSQ